MADINALRNTFFVNIGDVVQAAGSPTDPDIAITAATLPKTESGCRATYLIDGTNYFNAIQEEIAKLLSGGMDRFFYTNCWSLGTSPTPGMVEIAEGSFTSAWSKDAKTAVPDEPAFELEDGTPPYHPFIEDIKAMAAGGVDVRLLVWASPFLVNLEKVGTQLSQTWGVNVHSLLSALDLRGLPGMSNKVVLNTLAHTLGAMHLKMVVCGDSTGFRAYAAGIDFAQNRNTPPVHDHYPNNYWHDVGIKIEGIGANALYQYFAQLWNEQVQRSPAEFKAFGQEIKAWVDDTPLLDIRETVPIVDGKHHLQVLRTIPTMNFTYFASDRMKEVGCLERIITGFRQDKILFAENGVYEFRAAQRKAIRWATEFIYIEDQAFTNFELAEWINDRLRNVPGLKVILMHMRDPLDRPSPILPVLMDKLIAGVATPEERVVFAMAPYTIHAKLTIIDDKWAVIGSANCMRRSFYMDGEISVSVLDEEEPSFAAFLRKDLWGEHCGVKPGPDCDDLKLLADALGIWRPSWGAAPSGFSIRPDIALKTIPFVYMPEPAPPNAFPGLRPDPIPELARDLEDGDSRLEY